MTVLRFRPQWFRVIHQFPDGPLDSFATRKEMADYLRGVRNDKWPIFRRGASFHWRCPIDATVYGVALPTSSIAIERFLGEPNAV